MRHVDIRTTMNVYGKAMDTSIPHLYLLTVPLLVF